MPVATDAHGIGTGDPRPHRSSWRASSTLRSSKSELPRARSYGARRARARIGTGGGPASGDGFSQSVWRLDGPHAAVAYETPGWLLPSTTFAPFTGYVVVGDAKHGFFTLSELGKERTPVGIGSCDTSAAIRVVRIDPTTGRQSYVATISRNIAGPQLDCHLTEGQAVEDHGAIYLLAGQWGDVTTYQWVARVLVNRA